MRVPPLPYQPFRKRVRACGEVLGPLPMPGDPSAGPMHVLPRISWLNWVRLALIPAGGDWRDLPGVLESGQARREKFKRHRMEKWGAPVDTIGGSRLPTGWGTSLTRGRRRSGARGPAGVIAFDQPAGTISGEAHSRPSGRNSRSLTRASRLRLATPTTTA